MRTALLVFVLIGCGPIQLGAEPVHGDGGQDAGPPRAPLHVVVRVANEGCEGCFALHATASGGQSPYYFEWEDGSRGPDRRVCPDDPVDAVEVTAFDADDARSVTQVTRLAFPDASCPPPPPLLCIENPSFEGKPAFNDGNLGSFDGEPWSLCTNPLALNSPDIGNDSIEQPVAEPPATTDGNTFLGMAEDEQVSQALCEPIEAGTELFLELDAQRLYVGAGVTPDTELPFLEVWGGLASDCSQRELLWASETLEPTWERYCIALRPQHYTTQITLRARSDRSLPSTSYLLVDNLVPVESCP